MKQEDAVLYILKWIRGDRKTRYPSYGYEVYLPNVIRAYVQENAGGQHLEQRHEEAGVRQYFSVFVDAAWELCRRGIIRPGVKQHGGQATPDGSGGAGYSVTAFGRQWLEEEHEDIVVPTEPGRFAEMLKPFAQRFGPGFYERAQQAIRCYGAHAYLACCAMCGAAAESVLLAIATKKLGNEDEALRVYSSRSGRRDLQNLIVGKADGHIKRGLEGLLELLKYWRDEAAHGKACGITENEAFTSLALLLRYATFVNENWAVLTSKAAGKQVEAKT